MAVFSERYNYIFFANPQTASKAIAKTLIDKVDGKQMPEKEITRDGNLLVRKHHASYSQLVEADLMSAAKLDGMFKFTCVRDPFDQLVSKYLKHCERLKNDETSYPWLKKAKRGTIGVDEATVKNRGFALWLLHLRERYVKTSKIEDNIMDFLDHADLVLRFESLSDGFAEFLKRVGIEESIPIVEFNVTEARAEAPKKKRNYADFYDPASVKLVETMYAPVIERFGYRFLA